MREFAQLLGVQGELDLEPSFNVAPTQAILVARCEEPRQRRLTLLRWGLVPFWSKGPDSRYSMINARADTIDSKPAYRAPFRKRRCLVAANGFYEWQRGATGKRPFFIGMADGSPFYMAGLWERWTGRDGTIIESCAIVTTEANGCVSDIHDRMPAILPREDYDAWLDTDLDDPNVLKALLRPYPAEAMCAYPVSTRVNSPANDDDLCMARIEED